MSYGPQINPNGLTNPVSEITMTSGVTITSGTGVPSTNQPIGSMWLRSDGTSGARLYISAGSSTWNAVAGV